jgi:S-DNA-T family DNA segregation ATPase FtsK/SpoIIIE
MASTGYNAATISPSDRGVGLLLAEDGIPTRLRTYYLGDAQVRQLAERATALRTTTELESVNGGAQA